MENEFLRKVQNLVLENLSDENFGVSELADAIGMSRSNLLRKIQKYANCSASTFIRDIRLQESYTLLQNSNLNISEISFQVGFNSTSYYVKCFRERYGVPPGEIRKQELASAPNKSLHPESSQPGWSAKRIFTFIAIFLLLATGTLVMVLKTQRPKPQPERSIAVLPFRNNSADSSNVYVINGVMESILNRLQSLSDIKVVSRTSVEQYRNSYKSLPEIARELNVNYIVEGSGQKIGSQILLSVQLIKAQNDKHIWSQQFERDLTDIFQIQAEVAEKIALSVHSAILPEEYRRLNEVPTQNMEAYDYYLKAMHEFNNETIEGLVLGIKLMKKAVNADPEFARAHAALAMAYFYADLFSPEKIHIDSLTHHADKALLIDPTLAAGLNAKALYYLQQNNDEQARQYLEKALEYNPNSAMVINTLSDFYTNREPNTQKYLEYALKGINLDIASNDAVTKSYIYLHVANALIQNGFIEEAITAINRSLDFNPNNLFSEYVRAYIIYAKNKDLIETQALLKKALAKDPNRFDIIQEVGNTYYYQKNWEEAGKYFSRFLEITDSMGQNMFVHRYAEIAYTYKQLHRDTTAEKLISIFEWYANNDGSVYQPLQKAYYFAYHENTDSTLFYLNEFSNQPNYQIWVPLFAPLDPMFSFLNDAQLTPINEKLQKSFWKSHTIIREKLEKEKLLDVLK